MRGAAILAMACLLALPGRVFSQKYISKSSAITFFSEAPVENIEAVNSKATSLIDLETGEIVFSVPIGAFQFKKSLMKQHFNENYMDTEIHPKSTFKGKVTGYQNQHGKYQAKAEGLLTIHGITNPLSIEGNMELSEDEITITTSFPVLLEDYKIKIPRILFSNIAESVDVKVQFVYQPYVSK